MQRDTDRENKSVCMLEGERETKKEGERDIDRDKVSVCMQLRRKREREN